MTTPNEPTRFGGNSNPQSPRSESSSSSGGNAFTRKIGPLPLWAWMGIALGVALAISMWQKNKANATNPNSITPPGSNPDQTSAASQIPQFVNISQNVEPPGAPPMIINNPAPATPGTPDYSQNPPNTIGMTLDQAKQALHSAGWIVNSVSDFDHPTVGVNQSVWGNSQVVTAAPHPTGQAGQFFAHSVSLQVVNR